MSLHSSTTQRPRCDCCLPFVVKCRTSFASDSLNMAGLTTDQGYNGAYTDIVAHWYLSGKPYSSFDVNYDPRTGVWSPTNRSPPGYAPYSSPVYIDSNQTGVLYGYGTLSDIVDERVRAKQDVPENLTTRPLGSVSNRFYSSGYANILIVPPSGSSHTLTFQYDILTNDASAFQFADKSSVKNFSFYFALPKPHISGSYEIRYRFLTRETHHVVRRTITTDTQSGQTGTVDGVLLDTDTYTFGNVVTLKLTPLPGAMEVESEAVEWPDATAGQAITIVGPDGSPSVTLVGKTVGDFAAKSGFLQRTLDTADAPVIHVYLKETATGAGCSGSQTWDPSLAGAQEGEPYTNTITGSVFTDPHDDNSTLPSLQEVIAPLWPGQPSDAYRPTSLTPTTASFTLPGVSSPLVLTLSDEFTTADLHGKIDALIDDPENHYQDGFRCEHYASSDETYYRKFVGYYQFDLSLLNSPVAEGGYGDSPIFADLSSTWTANFSLEWDEVTIGPDGTRSTALRSQSVVFKPEKKQYVHPSADDGPPFLSITAPEGSRVLIQNPRFDPPTNSRICPPVLAYSVPETDN